MTVNELWLALKKLPPDAPVMYWDVGVYGELGGKWLTPNEVSLDDDRVLIRMRSFEPER